MVTVSTTITYYWTQWGVSSVELSWGLWDMTPIKLWVQQVFSECYLLPLLATLQNASEKISTMTGPLKKQQPGGGFQIVATQIKSRASLQIGQHFVLFICALGSPHGPFPLYDSIHLCSRIPQCWKDSISETSSVPASLRAQKPSNSVRQERERDFSVKFVLTKSLLFFSLCGILHLPKINFLHLYSILNIWFCYETANRSICIIKVPEYFIALGFWFWSGPRAKANDTQTE